MVAPRIVPPLSCGSSNVSDDLINEKGFMKKSRIVVGPIAGDTERKNYMQAKQKTVLLACGDMIGLVVQVD